jgi:Na+-translocating ferredoxin:NAD+ oxidoreductase subunit B
MEDIYEKLAVFLDRLPAGYPKSKSGVELRILRKLFTPAEAELCLHLTLLGEEPRVIARRAKQPVEVVSRQLDEMEKKRVISGEHRPGKTTLYSAQQFVIGFWEGQVNRLDRELVEAFDEYLDTFSNPELWRKVPQLRTIPVGESIPVQAEAMPYEVAITLLESHSSFAISNCICRQEQQLIGKGCGKPLETCMSLGSVAENSIASGRARRITREEMRLILKQADEAGLVLQPANSKHPQFICACCGDCCGVLRTLKLQPKPASILSSPYLVAHDDDLCSGCGTCVERCQMDAITIPYGAAEVNLDRCIGCGLCVSTCDTGAMTLIRKPASEQPFIPNTIADMAIKLGQARGHLSYVDLLSMLIKSKIDRITARI